MSCSVHAQCIDLPQEALKFVEKYTTEKVRVLEFVRNRGKGGAVRMVCVPRMLSMVYLWYTSVLRWWLLMLRERERENHHREIPDTNFGFKHKIITEKFPIQILDSNTRSSTYNSYFWVLRYWVHSRGAEHKLSRGLGDNFIIKRLTSSNFECEK